jgi:nucleotide-binding universal stress UspA family protein
MLRKLLITVDGSIHSKGALAYMAGLLKQSPDVRFTIFNVQPIVSQYLLDEARINPRADAELRRVIDRQTAESEALLEKTREQFIRMGIASDCINVVSQVRRQGQAKDIIDYAHKHLYDAIIVGRRGLSRIQKAFMGSTSAKVVEHAASIPVWIVDGDVQARRILVAVDGSEASLQIVDYLGMMLGSQPHVRFCFYHVDETPGPSHATGEEPVRAVAGILAKGEQHWQDLFWKIAKQRLEAAGIHGSRTEHVTEPRSGRVAKMILQQVQDGDFDTVVLGRRGSGNSFFFGSVSHYVIERLTDRAVWLVG